MAWMPGALQKCLCRRSTTRQGSRPRRDVGTNLYLCKVAMDIMAKRIPPDAQGARIACLDEMTYRRELWDHRPLTDFWRVGGGISRKLEKQGIFTMGDIARISLDPGPFGEERLYKLFGVNAELLIDHAWGYEPCTVAQIKAYRPENQQRQLWPGAALPLWLGESKAHRPGNGGPAGHGSGGQGPGDPEADADPGL